MEVWLCPSDSFSREEHYIFKTSQIQRMNISCRKKVILAWQFPTDGEIK